MKKLTFAAIITAASAAYSSQAASINFDAQGLTGPSTFAAASPSPQTLNITTDDNGNPLPGTVTLEGGVILNQTVALPADQTSVYGTADFANNLSNPLTMTFNFGNPIQNFFLDVLNGEPFDVTYRVADNAGHSQDFTLIPNLSSGATTIGFAATGTQVTVTALNSANAWDFFVDNIHFNEALPSSLAPDFGSTLPLLSGALMTLGFMRRRTLRS